MELLEDGEEGEAISGVRSTLRSLRLWQDALVEALQDAGLYSGHDDRKLASAAALLQAV